MVCSSVAQLCGCWKVLNLLISGFILLYCSHVDLIQRILAGRMVSFLLCCDSVNFLLSFLL